MDITVVEQKDNFARIDVSVEKADYADEYKKRLSNITANASMRGFRKGHVPKGLITKMYGESIHVDAVSEAVSSKLMDFIQKQDFKPIGQPVLPEELQQGDKFKEDEMTLTFHLALIPQIDDATLLDSQDSLTYYKPVVTDAEVSEQIDQLLRSNSKFIDGDHIVPNAFISGTLAELDGDMPKEGGIQVDDTLVYPDFMTDEEEKAKFDGAPVDSIIVFNPYKAYGGKKSELKALFRLDEMTDEEVESYKESDFSYEVKRVSYSQKAELNQEFFDKVFGPDTVHSEEEARVKVRESLEQSQKANADYKFTDDLIKYISDEKVDKVELADATIKEWYKGSDIAKDLSEDEVESKFDDILKSLKLDIIVNHYAEKYGIKVTDDDLHNFARSYVVNQFAQMGLGSGLNDEIYDAQTDRLLQDDNFRYSAQQNMLRQMVAQKIHEEGLIAIAEQEVSSDELQQIIAGTPDTESESDETELPTAEEDANSSND